MDMMEIANINKALSSPVRLQIIAMLAGGEQCACRILERFAITQPTLSHHMHVLCDCHLVRDRKQGRWHYYALDEECIRCLASFFQELVQREKREGQTPCDEC